MSLYVGYIMLQGIAVDGSFQVRVGHDNLVGEVIRIDNDKATIQVYEETGMHCAGLYLA
jgi:vacuolar-type H+-ATPase catalytic subunit A/Vma1